MSDENHTSLPNGIGLPDRYEVELPSGAKAQVLRGGKGKHLELAERMAGAGASLASVRWQMAYIAVTCTVNGHPVTLEDVEEMPALDVVTLIGASLGKGGTVSAPVT